MSTQARPNVRKANIQGIIHSVSPVNRTIEPESPIEMDCDVFRNLYAKATARDILWWRRMWDGVRSPGDEETKSRCQKALTIFSLFLRKYRSYEDEHVKESIEYPKRQHLCINQKRQRCSNIRRKYCCIISRGRL